MFGPLLPYLSDSQTAVDAMFQRAAELGIEAIWVDALNRRPRVWPAVERLLRECFPDLHRRYRKILFDAKARTAYLRELRQRVDLAARRFRLTDRVAGCF